MRFYNRFTHSQKKTEKYKVLRAYYYMSWFLIIIGIFAVIIIDSILIYYRVWKVLELYMLSIILFMVPYGLLISGIYGVKKIIKSIPLIEWETVFKEEKENDKTIPWYLRKK